MAFVTITCPQCGGQAQIEAGRSVMCPYCAKELAAPSAEGGFAFAPQDVPQAAVQFAPPPAQAVVQMQPQQAAMPAQPYQQQYVVPQYTQEQLQLAEKKRKGWQTMNAAFIGGQTLLFALGLLYASLDLNFGVAMVLSWVLSLPVCGFLSGALRPDDAYLQKKPMFKSRIAQGFIQFLGGAAASAGVGAILFAILYSMFG